MRLPLVDLLSGAFDLRVQRVEDPKGQQAHTSRGGSTGPDPRASAFRADLAEVRDHDADDESHLDALAKTEDQRADVARAHFISRCDTRWRLSWVLGTPNRPDASLTISDLAGQE